MDKMESTLRHIGTKAMADLEAIIWSSFVILSVAMYRLDNTLLFDRLLERAVRVQQDLGVSFDALQRVEESALVSKMNP
jgi:hypothetical protein